MSHTEKLTGTSLASPYLPAGEPVVFTAQSSFPTSFTQSMLYFGSLEKIDRPAVLKIPRYPSQARHEWTASQKAFAARVPSPEPLSLVQTDHGAGVVFEFVKGEQLYKMGEPERRFGVGEIAGKMHQALPVPPERWETNEKSQASHFDRVRRNWDELGIQNADFDTSVMMYDTLSRQLLQEALTARPSFLHGDLHDGQVLVNGDRQTLIDFGAAREAQAVYDLAIYCYHTLRTKSSQENIRHLLAGYAEAAGLPEGDRKLIPFFLLYTALRSVEWYAYNQKAKLYYPLSHLPAVNAFIDGEKLWK